MKNKEKKIPKEQLLTFIDEVSKNVFRKPHKKLVKQEAYTLRLTLIQHLDSGNIDQNTYDQLVALMKSIDYRDPKVNTYKVN